MTLYRTIVADPPWEYGRTHGFNGTAPLLPYESMTVAQIAALPIADFAADEAHLYLWTTQRYLWRAPDIVSQWGFRVGSVITWCKPPRGFAFGDAWGTASEFIVFCRRGKLATNARIPRDWFEWPRGRHSRKPEAFLDLVEQVSPGPYLELFARRNRLGWDTWGNECTNHVEMTV